MPKIGGFSFSRVPRPGAPFNRRRRPSRPFFYGLGMALMSRYDIDFVTFDLAREGHGGPAIDDPLTQLLDHRPDVILVQVQFLGDLQAREIQPHEIQASDPGPERLAVVGEDGAG